VGEQVVFIDPSTEKDKSSKMRRLRFIVFGKLIETLPNHATDLRTCQEGNIAMALALIVRNALTRNRTRFNVFVALSKVEFKPPIKMAQLVNRF
jgi:hypothetical protein